MGAENIKSFFDIFFFQHFPTAHKFIFISLLSFFHTQCQPFKVRASFHSSPPGYTEFSMNVHSIPFLLNYLFYVPLLICQKKTQQDFNTHEQSIFTVHQRSSQFIAFKNWLCSFLHTYLVLKTLLTQTVGETLWRTQALFSVDLDPFLGLFSISGWVTLVSCLVVPTPLQYHSQFFPSITKNYTTNWVVSTAEICFRVFLEH